jgi:drug/metabolite transporter (DMT)-like permease
MTRRGAFDAALVIAVGIGWGLLGPATKALMHGDPVAFDGMSVVVARAVWALPVFAVIGAVLFARERPRLETKRWIAMAAGGVTYGLGITVLFSIAAGLTSISHLSFLIGASPVTNSAAAALAFRLPIGWRERTSLVLGLLGVGVLAGTHAGGSASIAGDGLMLVWLAAFALYAVLLRYIGPGISATLTMCGVGVVAMLAVIVAGLAVPGAFRGVPHVFDAPATAVWFFAEILLGSTFIGQIGYAIAVKRFGVSIATIGAEYTALMVGITTSILWRESWSPLTVLAGALLAGALGVTFAGRAGRETRVTGA